MSSALPVWKMLVPRWALFMLLCTVAGQPLYAAQGVQGQPPPEPNPSDSFTVEYYYKVRWGFQKEFWRLFQKNHLPLLQRQLNRREIYELRIEVPHFHQPDAARWDYRVTIVYPNAAAATKSFTDEEKRQLYPDQSTFRQEEQRRFELLLDHWDLPVTKAVIDQ